MIKAGSQDVASNVQANILASFYRAAENQCATKTALINEGKMGSTWPILFMLHVEERERQGEKCSHVTDAFTDLLLSSEAFSVLFKII